MTQCTDPRLINDAENLFEAVNQLVRVYQFRDRDRICCYDVSVTQCYALETLIKQGPLRMQALAEEMFLDKSTTSRVIDTLERKGYVERSVDREDKRAIQIRATKAGEALYQKIRIDLVAEELAMIANLSPEVRKASLALIKQLTRAAEIRCGLVKSCCPTPSKVSGL